MPTQLKHNKIYVLMIRMRELNSTNGRTNLMMLNNTRLDTKYGHYSSYTK